MKRILVIDDEEIIVSTISIILEDMGIEVAGVSDPEKGVKMALEGEYELILSDIRMPGKAGNQVTKEILAAKPEAKILIITAYPTDPLAEDALAAGAVGLLKKPFEISKILDFLAG